MKNFPTQDNRFSKRVSRRGFLAGSLAVAGAATMPAVGANAVTASSWNATLGGAATWKTDPAQFMPRSVLHEAQESLDAVGLRATGSRAHHTYVDRLAARMERAGLKSVTAEAVPFTQWAPIRWSLDLMGGSTAGAVEVAGYVPYTGPTGPEGVTGPLSLVPAPGVIGIIASPLTPIPLEVLAALDYDAPLYPRRPVGYDPTELYQRTWLANTFMQQYEAFAAAGAAGVVVALDLPREAARQLYSPYDGVIRSMPALFVDREVGAGLQKAALGGQHARLVLEATIQDITTPNLYGFIPGASEELVIVQSHTDGTNGLEENGPEAMLAMAQYLSRISKSQLPRTVMFLMSTGHMAGMAMGTEAFINRHRDGYVARTAAALCVEHLGARPWGPGPDGTWQVLPGSELHGVFASPHTEIVHIARRAQNRILGAGLNPVLRPFVPDTQGQSPNGLWWPGDGEGWWRIAGLPSIQTIAGPTYLLNAMPVMDFIDTQALRDMAITFTDTTLELTRTPKAQLQQRRPDDPGIALGSIQSYLVP